ncbi:MAG: 4-(cytidine 5'-diphospho)-2-C-methyl-D-erythritol kinase [Deltaproteobacteria bacterium]|nr:4-(cytidine 5'-diphospho)-2-C-methyl-D-erythritol kinase [Candidatus Anaeroferrophillus wilburensis]MBN2888736.1 4-(cytidine 5'-diphospho)-2-C-methyl-D-erythritol kinase [Deltaproteobacteria bacterium]
MMATQRSFVVPCPAKVNLVLSVVGRRSSDGYHLLDMAMEPISLYDLLHLTVSPSSSPTVELQCPALPAVASADNLVVKTAHRILTLAAERGVPTAYKFHFYLDKRIPHGAGLGGGSSNAAAVIGLLAEVLSLPLETAELSQLAAGIGADVPFFMTPTLCRVKGIGDRVLPAGKSRRRWYVLVKPPVLIDTFWAYKKLNYKLTKKNFNINMRQFFRPAKLVKKYNLFNDFEEIVFSEFPLLAEIKEWLLGRLAVAGALMSGSGSAVYAVFFDYRSAVAAYRQACEQWEGSDCRIFLAHTVF